MKNQKGFTLIELMIVVAIIAILAAIAIPQYQTYVVKSQVTRAIAEAGDMKTTVEDCVNNGHLTVAAGAGNCDPNVTGSDILSGDQQGSIAAVANTGVPQVTINADGSGSIIATFGNHASAKLTSTAQSVEWDRTTDGTWTCKATAVDVKYLPASCGG